MYSSPRVLHTKVHVKVMTDGRVTIHCVNPER